MRTVLVKTVLAKGLDAFGWFRTWLLVVAIVLATTWCSIGVSHAATLVNLELFPDSSVEPPGDRLDISVFLLPGEDKITFEVRAYRIAKKDASRIERIRARGIRNRAADGAFLLTKQLRAAESSRLSVNSLVVPYKDLDLPEGTHRIAYEIRGTCQGKTAFVQATRVTELMLTSQPRREVRQIRYHTLEVCESKRHKTAFFLEKPRGAESVPPSEKGVDVTEPEVISQETVKTITIKSPSTCTRREAEVTAASPEAAELLGDEDARLLRKQPWCPLSAFRSENNRVILLATNRERGKEADGPRFTDTITGDMTYGASVVNIPILAHKRGALENALKQRDPERYFLIESLNVLSRDEFVNDAGPNDVLLFVHGFRNSFDQAVLRTAQLQYDLRFPGAAVAFCWPSYSRLRREDYTRAQENADASGKALSDVLLVLVDKMGSATRGGQVERRKLHIIAHSLGNRVLLNALDEICSKKAPDSDTKLFGQVIMAAPDVDGSDFNARIQSVTKLSERVTYYYCRNDMALQASELVNAYRPVGRHPFFCDDLDTISADGVDTSFLYHNYYASSRQVLLDIMLLIHFAFEPDARIPPLLGRSKVGNRWHWTFVPLVADSQLAGP